MIIAHTRIPALLIAALMTGCATRASGYDATSMCRPETPKAHLGHVVVKAYLARTGNGLGESSPSRMHDKFAQIDADLTELEAKGCTTYRHFVFRKSGNTTFDIEWKLQQALFQDLPDATSRPALATPSPGGT